MKILHIAGGLPTEERPYYQPFIKAQIDSLIREGLDVTVYDVKGYNSSLNYIKAISHIKNLIERENIDLIHAHYSYCGFSALMANSKKIPVVLSLMGSDLLGSPDESGNITLRGKIDKIISNFVAKRVDHIIVKSNEMKKYTNFSIPVSVIPNGVNFEVFKPMDQKAARRKLGMDPDEFVVLFLGKPSVARKNYKLAERSVEIFKEKFPDANINLTVPYGIDQFQIAEYMNAADVLLLTSFIEGSPNVIKEAMACNLPIISTDVGDVKEIMHNINNCYLVNFDENEISEKLKTVSDNRRRSDGREKINHLRDEMIAKQIINIYEQSSGKKFLISEFA